MQFDNLVSGERRQAFLEHRSLLVLTGPARFEWRHSIPARKSDEFEGRRLPRNRRVSLTYRNVTVAVDD
jgi:alkylated DNA repair dioxygenase AlkB